MRRAKRPRVDEADARRQQARDRVDRRDRQRLVEAQRRQQPRQPPREHRLARARRTAEEQVVRARRRDLERAPRDQLTAHVREIVDRARSRRSPARRAARPAPGSATRARATASQSDRTGKQPQPVDDAGLREDSPRGNISDGVAPSGATPRRSAAAPASAECRRRATGRRRSCTAAARGAGSTPDAARMPSAIGRSNAAPTLRTSVGARLTVTRSAGNGNPELRIAVRTRSRLSRTVASGSPTIVTPGNPGRDVDFDRDAEARRRQTPPPPTVARAHDGQRKLRAIRASMRSGIFGRAWQKLPCRATSRLNLLRTGSASELPALVYLLTVSLSPTTIVSDESWLMRLRSVDRRVEVPGDARERVARTHAVGRAAEAADADDDAALAAGAGRPAARSRAAAGIISVWPARTLAVLRRSFAARSSAVVTLNCRAMLASVSPRLTE